MKYNIFGYPPERNSLCINELSYHRALTKAYREVGVSDFIIIFQDNSGSTPSLSSKSSSYICCMNSDYSCCFAVRNICKSREQQLHHFFESIAA